MAGAGDLLLPDPREVEALNRARQHVLERIAAACGRAGRDPGAVALLAVSKNVSADRLRAAVAAGLTTLGENRVQEAEAKVDLVPGANWELVGPLQSNKARRALETFARIQAVDSLELARRLDRLAGEVLPDRRYRVLVQVNVDQDPGKAGFPPAGTDEAMDELAHLANLAIDGFMTIGRLTSSAAEARETFEGLRETAARIRGRWPAIGPELSMGMSDDFELAIEEGATIVRVGRTLFGERH
jgi:hypothetical protein